MHRQWFDGDAPRGHSDERNLDQSTVFDNRSWQTCRGSRDSVRVHHRHPCVGTRRGVARKPLIEPVDRRRFGGESTTNQTPTEMISDEEVIEAFRIGTLLDHERKFNTETLKTLCRGHGVGMTPRDLTEIESHADRTVIDDVRE